MSKTPYLVFSALAVGLMMDRIFPLSWGGELIGKGVSISDDELSFHDYRKNAIKEEERWKMEARAELEAEKEQDHATKKSSTESTEANGPRLQK